MTTRVASEPFLTKAEVRAWPNCGCVDSDTPGDAVVEAAIDAASDTLAIVSGMRIAGRQRVRARPCRTASCSPCPCCDLDAVPLGDERPDDIAVRIEGDVVSASFYWLHWNRVSWMLARKPDESIGQRTPPMWPNVQDRWRAHTEERTWSVEWDQGIHIDEHVIKAAALEVTCDYLSDDSVWKFLLDGLTDVDLNGASVRIDPNRLAEAQDTRLQRIANGELGPFTRRMMGIMVPQGRSTSMVYAPELTFGWEMNLEIAA